MGGGGGFHGGQLQWGRQGPHCRKKMTNHVRFCKCHTGGSKGGADERHQRQHPGEGEAEWDLNLGQLSTDLEVPFHL